MEQPPSKMTAERRTAWLLVAVLLAQLIMLSLQAPAEGVGSNLLESAVLRLVMPLARGVDVAAGGASGLTEPVQTLFMHAYLVSTALHALHLTAGIVIVAWLAAGARGRLALPERAVVIELGGLYWHLVDVIWVFLFPVLYLAR